jgi:hypothetical protein
VFLDPTGDAGELDVEVDESYLGGESYEYAAHTDTAIVDTGDGGHLAFTDTDNDGEPDLMTVVGSDGTVASQSRLDAATGEWVALRHDPGEISVDGAASGLATIDSDGDGHADTFTTVDAAGDTVLYTDTDGDGRADVESVITGDGGITISDHTGDGDWTQVESGHIGADGSYHVDTTRDAGDDEHWLSHPPGDSADPDVVRIDPVTGEWIRRG